MAGNGYVELCPIGHQHAGGTRGGYVGMELQGLTSKGRWDERWKGPKAACRLQAARGRGYAREELGEWTCVFLTPFLSPLAKK